MAMRSHDVDEWLANNRDDFRPPVCNTCMFDEQLKVFFIGGPNERDDYHIEVGEELFVQLRGDMCLKVVERGGLRDVRIKQGQMFLLPARVPHSPQRRADTVGMVVERARSGELNELDGLRWHYEQGDGDMGVLYERWFLLKDIVKDLPPAIAAYKASAACAARRPDATSVVPADRPYDIDEEVTLMEPVDIADVIERSKAEMSKTGRAVVFGPPDFDTEVTLYGEGAHKLDAPDAGDGWAETLLWLQSGSAVARCGGAMVYLTSAPAACRVPAGQACSLHVNDGGYCFAVRMATPQ